MTGFKSGTTDHTAIAKRREELFGPARGAENGVDTTRRPDPPKFEPGDYPGYDDLSGFKAEFEAALKRAGLHLSAEEALRLLIRRTVSL